MVTPLIRSNLVPIERTPEDLQLSATITNIVFRNFAAEAKERCRSLFRWRNNALHVVPGSILFTAAASLALTGQYSPKVAAPYINPKDTA